MTITDHRQAMLDDLLGTFAELDDIGQREVLRDAMRLRVAQDVSEADPSAPRLDWWVAEDPCPSWCQALHAVGTGPQHLCDRFHYTHSRSIALSREVLWGDGEQPVTHFGEVTVYLERAFGQRDSVLVLITVVELRDKQTDRPMRTTEYEQRLMIDEGAELHALLGEQVALARGTVATADGEDVR